MSPFQEKARTSTAFVSPTLFNTTNGNKTIYMQKIYFADASLHRHLIPLTISRSTALLSPLVTSSCSSHSVQDTDRVKRLLRNAYLLNSDFKAVQFGVKMCHVKKRYSHLSTSSAKFVVLGSF